MSALIDELALPDLPIPDLAVPDVEVPAVAVPGVAVPDATAAAARGARPAPYRLHLVTGAHGAERLAPGRGGTGRSGTAAGRAGQARPAPLRLTRRGQVVVGALAAVVASAGLLLAGAASGGAQAANHGVAGGGYAGMHEIVVQPGQTLWSIATRVDPSGDPRLMVAEIMTANSMTSPTLDAGQLLWVPK
jgi:hypothetical protein